MSLRLESVWCLNPKRSHPRYSIIPNLRTNPHSLFAPPRILTLRLTTTTSFLAFAAPREEGAEIEEENKKNDRRIGAEESWKQALDTFREQASKIREASQESYELYSEKAILVLKDAAEELRVTAKEIGEEGKQFLAEAAENSPEVKDIIETFTSPNDNLGQISQLRDFYVGVPYGLVLSVGGFVSFMVTGSIAALRFGIVLGGVLLALSVSSLSLFCECDGFVFVGLAAIASILFLREIRLLAAEILRNNNFVYICSGAVVAFYVYRLVLEHKQQNASNLENGAENYVIDTSTYCGVQPSFELEYHELVLPLNVTLASLVSFPFANGILVEKSVLSRLKVLFYKQEQSSFTMPVIGDMMGGTRVS
ncbi:Protein FATTY ACID EXPORT 3, chloroplastic, partial [Mucuna pruriens]